MPLKMGFSRPTLSKNIATEIRSGKKPAQASAIAYSLARKAKGFADGGKVMDRNALLEKLFQKKMSEGGLAGYSDGGEVAADEEMDLSDDTLDDDEPTEEESDEEEKPSRDKFIQSLFLRRAMGRRG